MSVATEIQRLQLAKEDIKSAIIEKGGTVEESALIDSYGDAIREIESDYKYEDYIACFDFRNYESEKISVSSMGALSYSVLTDITQGNNKIGFCMNNTFVKECIAIFPNATFGRHAFRDCSNITYIKVDLSNMKDAGNVTAYNNMFCNCSKLETIDALIDGSNCSFDDGTFNGCYNLKNVRFVPLSIKSNISFGDSPLLSDESIQNIIVSLSDLTGQTSKTLTFHADVKAKLTEEQIATITSKNWTLA